MITQRGRFLIRIEEQDLDYITNFDFGKLEKEYQKIKEFFMIKNDIPLIRLCFIYDEKEYLFFVGKEHKFKWAWANTNYRGTICIFSPSVCEKYTTHKKEEIFKTLVHEMHHVLYCYSGFNTNIIFNEGIAYYYMNKQNSFKFPEKIETLMLTKDYMTDIPKGYFLTKIIIEKIEKGNEKIIEFLSKTKNCQNDKSLFKNFKDVFCSLPNDLLKMKGGGLK